MRSLMTVWVKGIKSGVQRPLSSIVLIFIEIKGGERMRMNQEEKTLLREVLIVANNDERFFDHLSNKLDLNCEYLTEVIDKLIRGLS